MSPGPLIFNIDQFKKELLNRLKSNAPPNIYVDETMYYKELCVVGEAMASFYTTDTVCAALQIGENQYDITQKANQLMQLKESLHKAAHPGMRYYATEALSDALFMAIPETYTSEKSAQDLAKAFFNYQQSCSNCSNVESEKETAWDRVIELFLPLTRHDGPIQSFKSIAWYS